jgi:hypothetical protein
VGRGDTGGESLNERAATGETMGEAARICERGGRPMLNRDASSQALMVTEGENGRGTGDCGGAGGDGERLSKSMPSLTAMHDERAGGHGDLLGDEDCRLMRRSSKLCEVGEGAGGTKQTSAFRSRRQFCRGEGDLLKTSFQLDPELGGEL